MDGNRTNVIRHLLRPYCRMDMSPLDPFDEGGGGHRGEVRALVGFLDERDAVAEEAFEEFCS